MHFIQPKELDTGKRDSIGLQPGPKEPRGTEINNYLAPLVDELLLLFDGLMMDVNVNGEIRRETH